MEKNNRDVKGRFLKGNHYSKSTEIKKGQHLSSKTEFKMNLVPLNAIKKGEHRGKATEFKKNLIPWIKGKHHTNISNQKNRIKHLGKISSEETRKKQSEALKREKSYLWKGGKSFEPYGLEFDKGLKEQIRKRDQYRCQQCFRHQDELRKKLDVHHIDFNKRNNKFSNLISLCRNCHAQTQFNRDNWINYFQEKMVFKS